MQKIQSAYSLFQKAVIFFLTVCMVWIGIGTVKYISAITIVSKQNAWSVFFFGFFLFTLLVLFIRWMFLWIARLDSPRTQYLIAAGLHLLMAAVFAVLLTQFDVNLRNDAYQDVDTACYLANHTSIPVDNKYPGELLSFGNNYFFIWLTSKIIRVLFAMGISDIVPYLQGINAAAMVLGAFFSWLLTKEILDIKAANQVLLLCVLNPLFYGFTFWYYSNSLSIPLMMAIPYIALKIWRADRLSHRLVLSTLEGGLLFFGYELRPTAVFPFIAICLIAFFYLFGSHSCTPDKVRSLLLCAGVLLVVLAVSFSGFSKVRSAHFGELMPHNRPITYWLAMGAHGTGNLVTNRSDVQFVKSLGDDDNKALLCLQRAIRHYRKNGVAGTIDLWARKTATVWSDGYGGISRRIIAGESETPLYGLLAGSNQELFSLYCQVFRLLTIAGLFLFCVYSFGKPIPAPIFTLVITLFGGIVFYFFWEARAFYSAPFVPTMLILARDGIARLFERQPDWFRSDKTIRWLPVLCSLSISLFVCLDFYYVASETTSADHMRIYTRGKHRHYAAIIGEDVTDIEQDFYVRKSFNRIVLPAKCRKMYSDFSDYRISLSDDSRELYSTTVSKMSVQNNRITLTFDPIVSGGHFTLHIQKLNPEKPYITFFKKYDSYYIDAYRGELTVNGKGGYINDLGMNVLLHAESEPYLPKEARFIIAGLLLMIAAATIRANVNLSR